MNPFDECLKVLAAVFGNLAVLLLGGAIVEPMFQGANIFEVRPFNALIGLAGVLVLLSFFVLHQRKP